MSLIHRTLENNTLDTGMPSKSTKTRGRGGRDRVRVRWDSETNSDPKEMSGKPIKPESQSISDQ